MQQLPPEARFFFDLANEIEDLPLGPGDRFDMRHWGDRTTCGTTACLAGWMSLLPKYQEMGFTSYWNIRNGGLCTTYGDEEDDWGAMACDCFGKEIGGTLERVFYQCALDRAGVIDYLRAIATNFVKESTHATR